MMLRFFAIFIFLHGLIHLMGFGKAFTYFKISQLTQPVSRAAGAFWGIAALLFIVAAVLFFMKKDSWWIWAAVAVVLSQILIFTSWQDAKFGTIANLLIAAGVVIGYGHWSFNSLVNNELQAFFNQPLEKTGIVTEEKLTTLPPAVQTWLRRSGVAGKPGIATVRLRQIGEMRTSPGGKWMHVEAEQYFTVHPPGFIWLADVRMMPLVNLAGRDKFMDGKGHMLIEALSLVPVADAKGAEIDQGTLVRYLSEIIWFPQAALADYIRWEGVDSTAAKATMTYGGITAEGIFRFTPEGDLQSFEADRYYDRKGTATLERWHIKSKAWDQMSGVRMPVVSEVTWKLKEGDFTWYKLEITQLEYDSK